jgi:hypothetical protein
MAARFPIIASAVGMAIGVKNLIRGIRDGLIKESIVKHRRYREGVELEGDDARREGIYIIAYGIFWFVLMGLLMYAGLVGHD